MDERINKLIDRWKKRNIQGLYCNNKEEAASKMLELIPQTASIGLSGSVTMEQLGIVKTFIERGNSVFNQYTPGITREENLRIRRLGTQADYYLSSSNAVSETGELVFLSAYGNRISGISNARNVIIVAGINKITQDLDSALKRARDYAAPLNCKRLEWNTPCFSRSTISCSGGIPTERKRGSGKDGLCHNDICLFPEYKRMCCQILVIEAEVAPERLKVILVGEEMGF